MKRRARSSGGSVSLLAVTAMAVILMFGLLVVYREGGIKVEVAARSQLQTDRAQREEALLRELVARLPGVAAEAMRRGYDTEAAGAGRLGIIAAAHRLRRHSRKPRHQLPQQGFLPLGAIRLQLAARRHLDLDPAFPIDHQQPEHQDDRHRRHGQERHRPAGGPCATLHQRPPPV